MADITEQAMPPLDQGNYGYVPSATWCLVFIVLFGVSAAVHSVQALRSKYWIIFPTLVIGALVEVLGWAGRYWSSQNIALLDPFLMQICTLIMAPVFFSAYCYAVLGSAIHKLGAQYSVLPANSYFIVFITADVISLVLQAIGGGQAASSAADHAPTQSATTIMVVGIIFQLVTMGVFIALGVDFCLRAATDKPYAFRIRALENQRRKAEEKRVEKELKAAAAAGAHPGTSTPPGEVPPTERSFSESGDVEKRAAPPADPIAADKHEMKRWWIMAAGVGIASAMIFVRGIYRSIELVEGWEGYLITHEIYQNVLDGIPMVIAVAIFNIINPLWVLPKKTSWRSYY